MPDIKLTDNDIKKALEHHKKHRCFDCPLRDNEKSCSVTICTLALDYINRIEAENERLKNILICFMGALGKVRNIDDIESISQIPIMTELNKGIRAEIKAEAIKEFAERLKEKAFAKHKTIDNEYLFEFDGTFIDNLLKEMVGEDNAKEKE